MITEDFVIQGLLKEVLRSESVFSVDDCTVQFKIVDLLESKIRDSSENKKILIRLLSTGTLPSGRFNARGGFYRSLVQFESTLIESTGNQLFWIEVPKVLNLLNYRKDERSPVKSSLRKACPILMITNGIHCEGTFTIEDTSFEGVGGLLQVPTGFPCSPSTEVRGKLYLDKGELEIKGTLVRVNLLSELKFGYDAYSVGIKQSLQEPRIEGEDTRAHQRYPIRHELSLIPLIHPDHRFKVDLIDISISGFSGRLIAGSVMPAFPVGTIFNFPEKTTKVALVNFSNDIYRFEIVSRSENEAIEWLRTMTPVLYEGAQCSVKDARDLYKIFLHAGAISTQYLKRHELYEDSLVKEHSNIEDESGYLHRWYAKGISGEVEAHISAIRVSDRCWFIGDLAKVKDSSVDGEKLVKSFFKSFSMLAAEMKPLPCIMGMWITEHPLWKTWDRSLGSLPDEVISCVKLNYFRVTNQFFEPMGQFSYQEVSNGNLSTIKRIRNQIKDQNIIDFLTSVLDFDINTFGSPSLSTMAPGFKRSYFEAKFAGSSHLVVVTSYSKGKSINRVMDSVYVTQISGNILDATNETEFIKLVGGIALQSGVTASSIRVISSNVAGQTSGQEMKCYVLTPTGYGSFEGFS